MKKKIMKMVAICICLSLIAQPMLNTKIFALNVNPGGSFSGSLSCGVYEGAISTTGSNASITSGANWCDRGQTVYAQAVAGSAGTATINFVAVDLVNTDAGTEVPVGTVMGSTSVSVVNNTGGGNTGGGNAGGGNTGGGNSGGNTGGNVVEQPNGTQQTEPEQEKETEEETVNLDLASLSVSKGELSPVFGAATTNYTVELTNDVKEITVDAKAVDAKATVSGSGKHNLKEGENKIEVKVSANDKSKVYTIIVFVEKKPEINIDFNGGKLGILSLKSAPKIDGFEEHKLNIDGKEVVGQKKMTTGLILLYIVNDKDERNYYIYDEKKKEITSIYIPIALYGKNYAIVTVPEEVRTMEGYTFGKVKIGESEIEGLSFKEKTLENYKLVYLMNDNDEAKLYQFEKTSETLQPYNGTAPIMQKEYEALKKDAQMKNILLYTTIGLGVVSLGLFAGLLFMLLKQIQKKK